MFSMAESFLTYGNPELKNGCFGKLWKPSVGGGGGEGGWGNNSIVLPRYAADI